MRLLLISVLSVCCCLGDSPHFSVEQVLSSPFPSNLTASPKGDAIAWVITAKGVRNIWTAKAPGFEPKQLTRFQNDDGQELTGIAWTPDATAIAFVRGDGANPGNDPAGTEQAVWLAPLAAEPRRISEGGNPAWSPDGALLVWVRNGQVWAAASDGSRAPAQWIHSRGRAGELRWSPDGQKLAFASDRGDHAFIAVYRIAGHTLTFLDPSVDRDQAPVWSPDSQTVAFLRIPATRATSPWGQAPKMLAQPFSVRTANVATGDGKEVWRAPVGPGSRFWGMSAANQLLWAAGDRLLFPWEGDGWLHLYSVAAAGGTPKLLTPGSFEIEHAALDADGKSVVVSSNQDDADRRHLWRIPVSGGAAKRLTPGNGIEYAPAALAGNQLALLRSDAKVPARPAVLESTGIRDLGPMNFPVAAAMVEPKPVLIDSADGMKIHGQLFLPTTGGKHPAVVFFHGGPRRQMYLGWSSMFYYHQAYGFNQYLASKGYVVLSVNYRGGSGYGAAFREADDYGATGASEYNDVIGAGLFLRNRNDVDGAKIGLWGGSYGGYLTALGLARASDMFAAGVDLHGVHDWNLEYGTDFDRADESRKREEFLRTAWLSSPMASMSTWKSPVLLIQGDDDHNVNFANTVQLAEALRVRGVEFEQLIFPDEVHDFLVFEHWLKAYRAADKFFDKHLLK